jgi:hypothetical protein
MAYAYVYIGNCLRTLADSLVVDWAFAISFQYVHLVRQAVEQGPGQALIAQRFSPSSNGRLVVMIRLTRS